MPARVRFMPSILLHLVNALLYAGAAAYFWRTRWRRHRAGRPQTITGPSPAWEHSIILVPLALHTWLLYRDHLRAGRSLPRRRHGIIGDCMAVDSDLLAGERRLPPGGLADPDSAGGCGRRAAAGDLPGHAARSPTPSSRPSSFTWCSRCSPTACSPSRRCTCC